MNQLILPLLFAVLSPFIWGFMNVLDKYLISYKIKNPLSFAPVVGMVNILIGIVLALFLSWQGINFKDLLFPVIAGLIGGLQFYFYYLMLKKQDASQMIGLIYIYPLIVAVLSLLFLNEVLSLISYFGMALILIGVVLLSVRIRKLKLNISLWIVITMIFVVAIYEFFIKIASSNIPEINGVAISSIFFGVPILFILFNKKIRKGFKYELRNTKWAFLAESFTFLGMFTLYLAMAGLPATIVSSIAAIQPLAVLFFERMADKFIGKMTKDHLLLPKLVSILLIVIGVILLYAPEIIKAMAG